MHYQRGLGKTQNLTRLKNFETRSYDENEDLNLHAKSDIFDQRRKSLLTSVNNTEVRQDTEQQGQTKTDSHSRGPYDFLPATSEKEQPHDESIGAFATIGPTTTQRTRSRLLNIVRTEMANASNAPKSR